MEWRRSRKLVFSYCARSAPGPPGRPQSSALHDSARRGPTKEAHRRAMNRSGGLLHSEVGRASAKAGSPQRMIKEASKTSDRVTLHML
jgi:hypothetical protein